MTDVREFKDIRGGTARDVVPVEEFMAELEGIQRSICVDRNQVWGHVADGTLSLEFLKRFCKEYYFLGVRYTSEFGSLVATPPTPTRSPSTPASTSRTGSRTSPTRPASPETAITST